MLFSIISSHNVHIVAHSNDLCNMIDNMNLTLLWVWRRKNIVRVDRKRGGGGVIIAAKDDYICSEVTELHTQSEIAWMKMEIAGCKPLYICGYYKPSEWDSDSLEQFKDSLRKLGLVNSFILIAGDINFPGYDWENSCLMPNCNYPTLTYSLSHDGKPSKLQ